jgi:hypothetical protein
MLGLRENKIDINTIFKVHTDFVGERVERIINFYIDIFKLLNKIEKNKRIGLEKINNEIKQIKLKNSLPEYKKLIKVLLKTGVKYENEKRLYVIKYPKNRSKEINLITDYNSILENLLLDYKTILEFNFEKNLNANSLKYEKLKVYYKPIDFIMNIIFDYENWFSKLEIKEPWGPYQLTLALKINSCPYCNRQYIHTVSKVGDKKVSRPQLDHFLPQAVNPLVALSFFNLIPSCSTCNGPTVKGSKPINYKTHLNPYETNRKHRLMKFSYIPLDVKASIGKSDKLKIVVEYNGNSTDALLKQKVEGNISLFCLDELYQNHTDLVQEIIRRRYISGDKYIENLLKSYTSFNISREEAYRLAYGNYYEAKHFHKRTLSKITRDIAIELGTLIDFKKKKP